MLRHNKAELLKKHTKEPYSRIIPLIGEGAEAGIHLCELVKMTGMEDRALRKSIEHLRRSGAVIASDADHGYYFPASVSELGAYVRKEEQRARSTFHTIKTARKLYKSIIKQTKEDV